jgi:glutamate 5-kinase
VANLVAADLLILLTDQKGLFTADPRFHPGAQLISTVEQIDDALLALAKGSSTHLGTGGMITKLEAAQLAMQSGTSTVIASSSIPEVLKKIINGEAIGTFFRPHTSSRESRKRWLLSEKVSGMLFLDNGAVEQLLKKGASLLPVGISKIAKTFDRGAIVQLATMEGKPIGTGIANYSSQEIEQLIGLQTDQIEERLGYTYGGEIVHRDNMSLIKG